MPFLRERSGRWSPVKISAFVAALLPALWIAYQAAADELGARPSPRRSTRAGDWRTVLLITLAIDAGAAYLELSPHHPGAAHPRRRIVRATPSCIFRFTCSINIFDCSRWRARSSCASISRSRAGIGEPDRARFD